MSTIQISARRNVTAATAVRVLTVFEAATFILSALLHLRLRVPLGFAVLEEPRIIPATIVEGLAGVLSAVSVYAVFARRSWAASSALSSHVFSLAGVLLGIGALAAGAGPRTALNEDYHRVMLVVLTAGLALLALRGTRAELNGDDRTAGPGN